MMKRIYLLCAVAALALALAACGGSSASSRDAGSSAPASSASAGSSSAAPSEEGTAVDQTNSGSLDAAYDALLAANPISNPFELAALNIEYDFGLVPESIVQYKGVKSNDNGDAGLVLVIQPAEGKAEEICTALETYKEDQTAFYSNYAEFAQAKANVEQAIISGRDDQVVMVIASLEADAAALGDAVDAAMN